MPVVYLPVLHRDDFATQANFEEATRRQEVILENLKTLRALQSIFQFHNRKKETTNDNQTPRL